MRVRASLAALPLFLFAGVASAQSFRGGIQGVVLDQTGAALPGATVAAKSADTGLVRTHHLDSAGNYAFPELPLGDYDVTGSLSGFASQTVKGVRVDASAAHRVNLDAQRAGSPRASRSRPTCRSSTRPRNTQGGTMQGDQVGGAAA